jgi:hypothetical protein
MAAAHCRPVQSEMVRVTAWAVALKRVKIVVANKGESTFPRARQQEDAEAKLPWQWSVPAAPARPSIRCGYLVHAVLTEGIVTPGNGVTTVMRFPRECDHPPGDQAYDMSEATMQ